MTYWTRSAAQDNVDALVKLGDYYFKGIGTSPLPSTTTTNDLEGEGDVSEIVGGGPQYEKAATFYQSAGTSRLSAMAMWNLGWMHETGQGVPQVSKGCFRISLFAETDSLSLFLTGLPPCETIPRFSARNFPLRLFPFYSLAHLSLRSSSIPRHLLSIRRDERLITLRT